MRKSKNILLLIATIAIFCVKHSCSDSNEKTVTKRQIPTSADTITHDPAARAKIFPRAPKLEVSDDKSSYQNIRDQYPHDHEMHEILDKNPHLATLLDFKNRPLLDSAARAEYEKFLSNEAIIRGARTGLLDAGSTQYSLAESITREMNADFFEMAIKWKNNPKRGRLIDTMEEILRKDNFNDAQSEQVQKSLAQSKINLFRTLYEASPDRARDIAARAQGTRMEALITYALRQQDHASAN